jgi:hypothetical protein
MTEAMQRAARVDTPAALMVAAGGVERQEPWAEAAGGAAGSPGPAFREPQPRGHAAPELEITK